MSNDSRAIAEIAAVSNPRKPRTITHYLYAPNNRAASDIAAELMRRGFRTEDRLGADGVNWLVLARHEEIVTDELLADAREFMDPAAAATKRLKTP